MKFTLSWLKDHSIPNKSEQHIIDSLNKIGLEVEKIENITAELSDFWFKNSLKLKSIQMQIV